MRRLRANPLISHIANLPASLMVRSMLYNRFDAGPLCVGYRISPWAKLGANPSGLGRRECGLTTSPMPLFVRINQPYKEQLGGKKQPMKKSTFSLAQHKAFFMELVAKTDHKILAAWAIECTERVIPYFEQQYPNDPRPRNAIETLHTWINTGVFKMAVIRKASLVAHAAARDVGDDNPARSAARAAGQTVATAHVPTHAIGGAIYALQAIHRASEPGEAEAAVNREREWQYQRLCELREHQIALE